MQTQAKKGKCSGHSGSSKGSRSRKIRSRASIRRHGRRTRDLSVTTSQNHFIKIKKSTHENIQMRNVQKKNIYNGIMSAVMSNNVPQKVKCMAEKN